MLKCHIKWFLLIPARFCQCVGGDERRLSGPRFTRVVLKSTQAVLNSTPRRHRQQGSNSNSLIAKHQHHHLKTSPEFSHLKPPYIPIQPPYTQSHTNILTIYTQTSKLPPPRTHQKCSKPSSPS